VIRSNLTRTDRLLTCGVFLIATSFLPAISFAQGSPFLTGATSLQAEILTWATPIAVIAIMALGFMAMVGRMSWAAAGLCILGVAIVFGAATLVPWIRSLFGV
jgi:type IV secretory pathway VirB2 component (pilin)